MPRLIDADKCEKDLIDRTYCTGYGGLTRIDVRNEMARQPTVDAEPVRHGHWINHFDDSFPIDTVECSICGEKEWMMTIINHNYCPNCGAKMDEVEDEE